MKFVLSIILTSLLAFAGGLWLPWWCIAIAGFISGIMIGQSPGKSFLGGFTGIFLLWCLLAWWIEIQNSSILSHKIAMILPLNGNSFLLILVTAIVGGLVGGFAAVTGSFLRSTR
jgi:hypothetical protein